MTELLIYKGEKMCKKNDDPAAVKTVKRTLAGHMLNKAISDGKTIEIPSLGIKIKPREKKVGCNAIFITARVGSTRLPNKHLLKIAGKCCIEYVFENVGKAKAFDKIILCTTALEEDDILQDWARRYGISVYRGSVKDKLERWKGAAESYDVDFFVTADADDLFCEPDLLDKALEQYKEENFDFIEAPEDLVCGAFTYGIKTEALKKVCAMKNTDDTEMMWSYFKDVPGFKLSVLKDFPLRYRRPEIRATLDYQEDYDFFKKIIERMNKIKVAIRLGNAIEILDSNPEWLKINQFRHEDWKKNQEKNTKLVLKEDKKKKSSKYSSNELKYLEQVLSAGKPGSTSGDFTQKFEEEFSKKFGSKYAVACNSGTSALHMALNGVGVGYGDEVIVPALSVIMNSTSIFHNNCVPVYADVDEHTFTINPKDVELKITEKTKAVVAVSLYGYPSKIKELKKICGNIPIIEDNAEHLGKLRSDISVYSLESSKHLTAGEMGVLLTNDGYFALKARQLSNHGFKNTLPDNGKTRSNVRVFQDPDYERHTNLGWNYRATEFQSAIALAQLENTDEVINRRRKYAEKFYNVYNLRADIFKPQKNNLDHTFWTFTVRCLEDRKFWRMFYKKFVENGGDGFWSAWKVQYLEPLIKTGEFKKHCPPLYNDLYFEEGACPIAETIQPQIIQHKFNYRDEELFDKQVFILERTIKEL